MKILGLYNNDCALELFQWLRDRGHEVILCTGEITPAWCRAQGFDLAVSYTYRYILPAETLRALGDNAVNLHNAVLPFNRGADPNIWSIVEGTPRGVTLHYMDAGLDKGFVIAQELVDDGDDETLASSYANLDRAAKALFKKAFRYYAYWPALKKQCMGAGTYHALRDGAAMKRVIDTYDIPIPVFRERLESAGKE